MRSKIIYKTITAIVIAALAVSPCRADSTKGKDARPDPNVSTQVQSEQKSELESLLDTVPDSAVLNKPSKDITDMITKCDEYISFIKERISEVKAIDSKIEGYDQKLGTASSLLEKGNVRGARADIDLIIKEVNAETSQRYNKVKAKADTFIDDVSKAELRVKDEVKAVTSFISRYDEIVKLTDEKNYFRADELATKLIDDVNKYDIRYDGEVIFSGTISGTDLKRYKGKNKLLDEITRYNETKLQPEVKKGNKIISQFYPAAKECETYIQDNNIDGLLDSDKGLQKLEILITRQPFSEKKEFCNDFRNISGKVYGTLTTLAKEKKKEYNTRIDEIGAQLESGKASDKEMDALLVELEKYMGLFKKYKDSLFSERYMK